jgi:two-component system NtrC family sensor kinase
MWGKRSRSFATQCPGSCGNPSQSVAQDTRGPCPAARGTVADGSCALLARGIDRFCGRTRSSGMISLTYSSVHRKLSVQLIFIVVVTVATVLAVMQWVDTRLSERALERDLHERALLTLRTVDSLWGRTAADDLRHGLVAMVEGDREITAIDIFRIVGGKAEVALSTRPSAEEAGGMLTPNELERVNAHDIGNATLPGHSPEDGWRMAIPLERQGSIVGAAQVEVSLSEVSRLIRGLRATALLSLIASIGLTSLALALFLERRVAWPVAALVDGMRRAEQGERGVRVAVPGEGEFGFLARSFNRMLGRIEELTAGLEEKVRRATQDLDDKNRELQATNEKLWQAQLEVGRSERLAAIGQMAATIAHELGTPLNSILGYTQLLLRDTPRSEQAEKLAIVESQVQRMIETIRSVLDRTRDRTVLRQPVPVAPLVSDAMALVSARLVSRNLEARSDVPADLPPVPGDATGLRQVLLNLLSNAIDATDPPGLVTVSARVISNDGARLPRLELAVQDTGHGMSPDELRRAFEPFYTTKAPGRGTGLGLVIVDHIVRAHGGHLITDSVPGRGTTMRVQLPLEG